MMQEAKIEKLYSAAGDIERAVSLPAMKERPDIIQCGPTFYILNVELDRYERGICFYAGLLSEVEVKT